MKNEKRHEKRTAFEMEFMAQKEKDIFGKNLINYNKDDYFQKINDFLNDNKKNVAFFINSYLPPYKDTKNYSVQVNELEKMTTFDNNFIIIYNRKFFYDVVSDNARDVFLTKTDRDTDLFGIYSIINKRFYALSLEAKYEMGVSSSIFLTETEANDYPDWYVFCGIPVAEWDVKEFIKTKICAQLEKVFPDINSIENYSKAELGKSVCDFTDEVINRDVHEYIIANTSPTMVEYTEHEFLLGFIHNFDIIYQKELPAEFMIMILSRIKDKTSLLESMKKFYLVKEALEKNKICLTLDEFAKKEIISATNQIDAKNVKLKIICKEDNFPYHATPEYKNEQVNKCITASYPKELLDNAPYFSLNEYRLFNFTNPIRNKYSRNIEVAVRYLRIEDIVSISYRNKDIYSHSEMMKKYDIYVANKKNKNN